MQVEAGGGREVDARSVGKQPDAGGRRDRQLPSAVHVRLLVCRVMVARSQSTIQRFMQKHFDVSLVLQALRSRLLFRCLDLDAAEANRDGPRRGRRGLTRFPRLLSQQLRDSGAAMAGDCFARSFAKALSLIEDLLRKGSFGFDLLGGHWWWLLSLHCSFTPNLFMRYALRISSDASNAVTGRISLPRKVHATKRTRILSVWPSSRKRFSPL